MKFELSERIVTKKDKSTIIAALEEHFRKISLKVKRTGDKIYVKSIEASFGSINRKDTTIIEVRINEGGYLCLADVNYRPSGCFWVICFILLFTTVGWLIPIIFYFYQKNIVKEAIKNVFSTVKDEFQSLNALSVISANSDIMLNESFLSVTATNDTNHLSNNLNEPLRQDYKFCTKCGFKNKISDNYCKKCGEKI